VSADGQGSPLRDLPSVDRLAAALRADADGDDRAPTTAEATAAARAALAARRRELVAGADDDVDVLALARARLRPSLRRVLNATGVVIHTNLGRAPLPAAARDAIGADAGGYSNLELDLDSGRRGRRDEHVRGLLCELTGAEDALVVNNGAAAVLLAAAALGEGRAVIVSRGQLVEIGGGFRIPDVVAQAGLEMVEVGTTNRTRLADYERALAACAAGLVLRVHQSNFRMSGFVEDVAIEQLCGLGVPVVDDIGSGALLDDVAVLEGEPAARRSVAAGAALVCFSADKLLGGPQGGILVGKRPAVERARRHPLARALRVGRLPLAGIAATLALYRDPERALREVPVLAMLTADPDELSGRAEAIAAACGGEVVHAVARVGGGALPMVELPGTAVAVEAPGGDVEALAGALRTGEPALLARVADGRVIIDPRTLAVSEDEQAVSAVRGALARMEG
jgi:L-seryl-tRNA(Ser) seleniumtransferase